MTLQDTRSSRTEPAARCLQDPGSGLALVFCSDDNFARALAVAMHSALEHLSPRIEPEIYILDNGIAGASKERLLKVADAAGAGRQLRWIHVPPERLAHLKRDRSGSLPVAAFSRLLIPELLPRRIGRAVFLDSDVLVRRDLSPLFQMDLGGALFGAVRDFFFPNGHPAVDERAPYFNSGVLVMDLDQWRSTGFADRVLAYAAARKDTRFMDQDAMNTVAEDWCELEPRWNVQQGLWHTDFAELRGLDRDALYGDAAVLHFTGAINKPWRFDSTSPGTVLWVRGLMRSGWYERIESLTWLVPWLSKRLVARIAGPRGLAFILRVRASVASRLRLSTP